MNRPLIEQEWQAGDTLDKGFLAIAPHIYAHDPFWPGEDEAEMARQFSAANPFMQQGRVWTGYIRDCARLAGFATLNAAGETVVNFGFWETINNRIPNHRLFRALMRWAKAQGASRLIGPINFSTLGKFRLRLDTPTCAPFAGEPYNPPWYQHLLGQMGFQPLARYFSLFEDADVVRQLSLPAPGTLLTISAGASAARRSSTGTLTPIRCNPIARRPAPVSPLARRAMSPGCCLRWRISASGRGSSKQS